jgi:hypothetical protein
VSDSILAPIPSPATVVETSKAEKEHGHGARQQMPGRFRSVTILRTGA